MPRRASPLISTGPTRHRLRRTARRPGVALALLLLFWAGGCDSSADREPSRFGETSPEENRDGPATTFVYLRGNSLRELHLTGGRDRVVTELPSTDVTASPATDVLAYVTSSSPTEDEDFIPRPELHVFDPSSNQDRLVGPGFGPQFRSDGDAVAYLEPVGARLCEGEVCAGLVQVNVFDLRTHEVSQWLGSGRWSLLGWAGESLLVGKQSPDARALLVGTNGAATPLAATPSQIWAASPDGGLVLLIKGRTAQLAALESDGIGRTLRTFPLGGRVLGEGTWAPDSSRVAAVGLGARGGRAPSSRLVIVDPRTGEMQPVPDSVGASGPVIWSADGRSLVYVRVDRARRDRLEAVLCNPFSGRSRPLLAWAHRVTPLRLAARGT